ncbi:hypothetical protein DITRI_Ditri10aG0054100 [Diplodiscus trichospermus]
MIKMLNPYSTAAKTAEILSKYRPIASKPEDRPTRTRKRCRVALSPPTLKRASTQVLGLSSPRPVVRSPAKNIFLQGFSHGIPQFFIPNFVTGGGLEGFPTPPASLVTLPLLPSPPSVPVLANKVTIPALDCMELREREKVIDFNTLAEIPKEKDMLRQLQRPPIEAL